MASTLLYAHAPPPIFNDLDSASWSVPTLELSQLWQMSQSLPKGDWEITPVQAWFLLTASYDVKRLLGEGGRHLDALKTELSMYVYDQLSFFLDGILTCLMTFATFRSSKSSFTFGVSLTYFRLVGCFAFGAVMDESRFWDAVSGVMGENIL
jgi:hypothetical protein